MNLLFSFNRITFIFLVSVLAFTLLVSCTPYYESYIYPKKINYSFSKDEIQCYKNIEKVMGNPKRVECLIIKIDFNQSDFKLFKAHYKLFKNLKKLVLYNSSFDNKHLVDIDFSVFENLEYLNITGVRVDMEQANIHQLKRLKYLSLTGCRLKEEPTELYQLDSLELLSLSVNYLTSISDEISNLRSLKELDISNNCLSNVPPSIGKIDSLMFFNYNNSKGIKVNEKEEKLCYNKLNEIPTFLFDLAHLKVFHVSKVEISDSLKDELNSKKGEDLYIFF